MINIHVFIVLYIFGFVFINPLHSGNPYISTFANIEDTDEMQHHALFRQGLHCL